MINNFLAREQTNKCNEYFVFEAYFPTFDFENVLEKSQRNNCLLHNKEYSPGHLDFISSIKECRVMSKIV